MSHAGIVINGFGESAFGFTRSVSPGQIVPIRTRGGGVELWQVVSTTTGGALTVDLTSPPQVIQDLDPERVYGRDLYLPKRLGCTTTQRYHASPIAAARELVEGRTIVRLDALDRALRWRPSTDGHAGAIFRRFRPAHPDEGHVYPRWQPSTTYATHERIVGDPGPATPGPFGDLGSNIGGGIPRYQFRCVGGGGVSAASMDWDAAFASWVATGLFTDGTCTWVIQGGAEGAWDPET